MAFSHLPQEANYPSCSLCSIQEPAQNPLKEPQFLSGSVSDFIILHFCSASQSYRTCLVKKIQIRSTRVSSVRLPTAWLPRLCHQVREIVSPGEQLQSRLQSQFPAELCVTLLATFQKIILTSKPALILTPSLASPPASAGKHISRSRGSP